MSKSCDHQWAKGRNRKPVCVRCGLDRELDKAFRDAVAEVQGLARSLAKLTGAGTMAYSTAIAVKMVDWNTVGTLREVANNMAEAVGNLAYLKEGK